MGRKGRTFYLDERVIAAIDSAARAAGLTPNQFVEKMGWLYAQLTGRIPLDAQPLGETRGGDRTTTKPSAQPTADDTERMP
jgi:hypothetical protein